MATLALAAAAMPTNDEVKKAVPTVKELMNPLVAEFRSRKKSAVEVGETAMAYAKEADTEAAKFLLLKGAIWYYAQAKDDAKAVAAIIALGEQVKDLPPEVLRNDILKPAIDHVSEQNVPGLFAQFRSASAQMEIAKLAPSIKRNRADEPTRRRYAELLGVTGDWKAALDVFAKLGDAKAVQAAKDEIGGKALASAADFWWDYKPTVALAVEAAKAHAVDLYRKAIVSGELTGLKKVVAEKRIASVLFADRFNVSDAAGISRGSGTPAASATQPANALYCVVDLSAGPDASKYPVSHLAAEPKGGFNTDEYKTTKLVLRRIEPGKFMMGGQHEATLTKPFYCGVFEVTQKQYELVTGSNPSYCRGDMRPVEKVSWNMIRGDSSIYDWPSSAKVDPHSFMGRMQVRTGLSFDLPTEAQWEYACRAGTTSEYNNGGATEDDLKRLGRYNGNQSDGKGGWSRHTTTVGSYQPNTWELYDMHGNVHEWCLDWHGNRSDSGVTDPSSPSSGSDRVLRGGCWSFNANRCISSYRGYINPSRYNSQDGFRLCMNPEGPVGASARGSGAPAASATSIGEYKFNYKLDKNGNAVLCGEPCVSPKPEGVLIVPDKIDGHTVTKIDNIAFKGCDKMTRIVLPPHLEEILHMKDGNPNPGAIFAGCPVLAAIEISGLNPNYASENGAFYTKDKKCLIAYPKTRSQITLARETTAVGGGAFHSCMFKTAKIPDSVDRLACYAFCQCPNLEVVEFPKIVDKISAYAFEGAPNMKKVVFHGDAPRRRAKGKDNLFARSSKDIVVEVKKGSKGWKAEGSMELPERWPTTGSASRPIRYIK